MPNKEVMCTNAMCFAVARMAATEQAFVYVNG